MTRAITVDTSDIESNIVNGYGNVTFKDYRYNSRSLNQPLIHPYGVLYRPNSKDVGYIMSDGVGGFIDKRIKGYTKLDEGGLSLQSNDCAVSLNKDIKLESDKFKVTLDDDSFTHSFVNRDDNGNATVIKELKQSVSELTLSLNKTTSADHLAFFTPLAEILDKVVEALENIEMSFNTHTHTYTFGVTTPPDVPLTLNPFFTSTYLIKLQEVKTG